MQNDELISPSLSNLIAAISALLISVLYLFTGLFYISS